MENHRTSQKTRAQTWIRKGPRLEVKGETSGHGAPSLVTARTRTRNQKKRRKLGRGSGPQKGEHDVATRKTTPMGRTPAKEAIHRGGDRPSRTILNAEERKMGLRQPKLTRRQLEILTRGLQTISETIIRGQRELLKELADS